MGTATLHCYQLHVVHKHTDFIVLFRVKERGEHSFVEVIPCGLLKCSIFILQIYSSPKRQGGGSQRSLTGQPGNSGGPPSLFTSAPSTLPTRASVQSKAKRLHFSNQSNAIKFREAGIAQYIVGWPRCTLYAASPSFTLNAPFNYSCVSGQTTILAATGLWIPLEKPPELPFGECKRPAPGVGLLANDGPGATPAGVRQLVILQFWYNKVFLLRAAPKAWKLWNCSTLLQNSLESKYFGVQFQ